MDSEIKQEIINGAAQIAAEQIRNDERFWDDIDVRISGDLIKGDKWGKWSAIAFIAMCIVIIIGFIQMVATVNGDWQRKYADIETRQAILDKKCEDYPLWRDMHRSQIEQLGINRKQK